MKTIKQLILDNLGGCQCDKTYTSRHPDPECLYCNGNYEGSLEEDIKKLIEEYIELAAEEAETEEIWPNIHLWSSQFIVDKESILKIKTQIK